LLALADVNEKYQKLLAELSAACFTKEKLLQDIDAIEQATKAAHAKEKSAAAARKEGGFGPAGGMFGATPTLRAFVDKRTQSIAAQLAGKTKGYVPAAIGFGQPGGAGRPGVFGMRPPQPGEILPFPLQEMLKLSGAQK